MSYQVFARKYRPRTFDDIIGQDHVVRTLRNAIERDRLAHAFLFVGPRGTGKTSTARILAKALNCGGGPKVDFDPDESLCIEIAEGRSLDVLEIDGASNNGVDEVRALRETAQYLPAHGRFKIYYIDEVHMLSTAAFNALLKTLEEPPPHVKFIFATTEPQKILATILSRCQRFDLRPIPTELIAAQLQRIASLEGIDLDEPAAWAIARGADGGMRDAQSMLDQLVAFCGDRVTEPDVLEVFGFTSREVVAGLLAALFARDTPAALRIVEEQAAAGRELGQLLDDVIDMLRALLVARIDPSAAGDGIPPEAWNRLAAAAESCPDDRILAMIDICAETESRMRWATHKRLPFEIGLMKAVQALSEFRIADVIKTIAGVADAPPPPATRPAARAEPEPAVDASAEKVPAPAAPAKAAAPDPPADPGPLPAETAPPAEAPARATPSKRAPRKTAARKPSGVARLDALIEAAPESEPEDDPPPTEPDPQPADPRASPAAADAPAEDPFFNDPLIRQALDLFKGKLAKSQTPRTEPPTRPT